jgi:glycosyltransferase involved in cell wall biosynthesis
VRVRPIDLNKVLVTPEESQRNQFPNGREQQRPFVSVIVATRNEEKHIGALLDSFANQTYPKNHFEVIIVDGMSKDRTLEIVEEYKDRLNIRVFENPRLRSTFAFNKGLDEAKGDLFMIVNGHSVLESGFIEEDINTFFQIRQNEPRLAGVGGIYINRSANVFGKIVALMYDSFFSGARSCRYCTKSHFSDSVIFGVFDKKMVISNGKFDEDFIGAGNDDELPLRLRSRGFKFYTNPHIIAYYSTRASFRGFLKQTFNYGVAKGLIVRKGYHEIEWRNPASYWFIPASLLIYEILLLFLLGLSNTYFIPALIPFLLYWIVDVSVSVQLLIKTRTLLCISLPVMYFTLHNVLGLSSLMGLALGKKAYS